MVTGQPGGSPDFIARLMAQGVAGSLGRPIVVDNRATGIIPAEIVWKAPADGYTVLVTSNSLWLFTLLQPAPFDPLNDFAPVTLVARAPNVLVVHPSLPVKSVNGLIALAKARPGALNYASSAIGTTSHLAAELFKSMAKVQIVRVPYKGAGAATSDLLTGQVHLAFFTATSVMPHVRSGRLRALAVTSAKPFALFPELPTVAASGLPGYESSATYAVLAPAKTPAPIIERLNLELVRYLGTDQARERLAETGAQAVGSAPRELLEEMKTELARMRTIVQVAR
jgi:tripartite-type tricarboxylate transporter receptor subunit TctC